MSEINGNEKKIFNTVIISDKVFGTKQLTHEVWLYIIMRLENITGMACIRVQFSV